MIPSDATKEEIALYTQGLCHVFAIALHRRFGWRVQLVLDQAERYWEDPADADNYIPSVVHALAIDEHGNAWDVRGVRAMRAIRKELQSWVYVVEYDTEELRDESELSTYVGCWADDGEEPIDRPLDEYSEEDVIAAEVIAVRCVASLTDQLKESERPSLAAPSDCSPNWR